MQLLAHNWAENRRKCVNLKVENIEISWKADNFWQKNTLKFSLPTWRIHEIKMHQVINTQLLEMQHHGTQVRSQDLWICVVLHLRLVRLLRVQSETLAGPRTTGTARSLLGAGFTDGGHKQRFHTDTWVVHLWRKKIIFKFTSYNFTELYNFEVRYYRALLYHPTKFKVHAYRHLSTMIFCKKTKAPTT